MKNLKTNLFVIAGFILLASCQKENLIGSGRVIEQQRTVTSLNKIVCSGVFDVFISQDDTESLSVITDDNLMDVVKTYTVGNTLYLELEEDINLKKVSKMEIYVSVIELSELNFSGVGNINGINLQLDDFELNASGVGDIELSGTSNYFYLNNYGVGNINAFDFVSNHVTIESSAVGQIKVNAVETISITSTGVGDIFYKGNPQVNKLNINGTGQVTKID